MTSPATPKYFQTMSPATTTPSTTTPSAPPQPSAPPPTSNNSSETPTTKSNDSPTPNTPKVHPPRKPLLRLELRDLSSPGAFSFLRLLHASTALEDAVHTVLHHLYTALPPHHIPPTRSITLVLEAMEGVAYTKGSSLDADHKSIHLSTDYIAHIPDARKKEEITGVLVHEMVHCWQHNAQGTAPGGLIEGIADWVRLKAGYAPPHWKRVAGGKDKWDSGYERTGFFLEWLEQLYGEDIVRRINNELRGCEYEGAAFWGKCCGKDVEALWEEYRAFLDKDSAGGSGSGALVEEDGQGGNQTAKQSQGGEAEMAKKFDIPDNKVIPVRPRFT
ncbi:unnamed protein product [Periconia digitata]|uniref:BSP-domain-containing protein n=1 Tax=Periconia digitata TaxID=1303443 RepID=A0A9W4XMN9_9PLEO|nr:unnamed protein product [Periconia digitata]